MRTAFTRAHTPGAHLLFALTLLAGACLWSISAAAQSRPPKISGAPLTTVKVGSWYKWRPTATDPDTPQRSLRYSIANKPSWLRFTVYSGLLEGSPPQAGTWSNIRITVTDGRSSATLPAFSITATKTSANNKPPTISGTPPAAVTVGSPYSFRPTAQDPEGRTLGFSIRNRPTWATFNTTTGQLSGTPTASHIGSYSNVGISVSDGTHSTSLPAFAISVAAVSTRAATVSWAPPTQNTNGSALRNLAGYRIAYGMSTNALTKTIELRNPGLSTYVVENLSPGTYYFAVRAFNSSGVESGLSNVASKTIR